MAWTRGVAWLRAAARPAEASAFRENRDNLAPGRLASLVQDCVADERHIVCHETGRGDGQPPAVCAGFAAHRDAGRSLALRIAAAGHLQPQTPSSAAG
ncbi:hypothetical protein AB0465_40625 [Streptomyces griseoviridis]|uniref:hypothetical protein n=1 Tax=Streptomyces griseoviridis TaxID=45398 RepID=UPI0033F244FC